MHKYAFTNYSQFCKLFCRVLTNTAIWLQIYKILCTDIKCVLSTLHHNTDMIFQICYHYQLMMGYYSDKTPKFSIVSTIQWEVTCLWWLLLCWMYFAIVPTLQVETNVPYIKGYVPYPLVRVLKEWICVLGLICRTEWDTPKMD